MPLIDSVKVCEAFYDCLYRQDEIEGIETGQVPEGAVVVEGIMATFALHPERLQSHKAEVEQWLRDLPTTFRNVSGGGWSFLNACDDRNGEQWTNLQQRVEQLLVLGIGLGLAGYCLPRNLWSAMPGGLPYISVSVK